MEPVANNSQLAVLADVIASAPGSESTGGLSETDTRQG
jgi:hypothetical protein